jgi:hypothetical protein
VKNQVPATNSAKANAADTPMSADSVFISEPASTA